MSLAQTFEDTIKRDGVAICPFVRIRGIPYIFSNIEPPSKWATTGSVDVDNEEYTWSKTYDFDGAEIVEEAGVKEGFGTNGGASFRFLLKGNQGTTYDDVWLDLLNPSLYREKNNQTNWYASLTSSMQPTDSTGSFNSRVADATVGDIVYMGTETMEVTKKVSGFRLGLDRGKYGSFQVYHQGDDKIIKNDGLGGPYIADHPLTLGGRNIQLFIATGEIEKDGTFKPYGDSLTSSVYTKLIYEGVIDSHEWEQDLLAVNIGTQGLSSLLDKEIATNLPRGTVDNQIIKEQVHFYLQKDRNRVYMQVATSGSDGEPDIYSVGNGQSYSNQLITFNGNYNSAPTVVDEGVYTLTELNGFLKDTILNPFGNGNKLGSPDQTGFRDIRLEIDNDTKANLTINLSLTKDGSGDPTLVNGDEFTTQIRLDATPNNSFWRAIGFEGVVEETADDSTFSDPLSSNDKKEVFFRASAENRPTANKRWPTFYMPDGNAVAGRLPKIYYRLDDKSPQALTSSLGYFRDDNEVFEIDGYIKLKNEVMRVSDSGTTTIEGQDWRWVEVAQRGAFFTDSEEYYFEWPEDVDPDQANPNAAGFGKEEVKQVLAFSKTNSFRQMLYYLLGGSGETGYNSTEYDKDFYGGSVAIPSELVLTSSFENIQDERIETSDLKASIIEEPISIREMFRSELIFNQAIMLPISLNAQSDEFDKVTNSYKIKILPLNKISEVANADQNLFVIDDIYGTEFDFLYETTNNNQIAARFLQLDDTNTLAFPTLYSTDQSRIINQIEIKSILNDNKPIMNIAPRSVGTYGRKPTMKLKTNFIPQFSKPIGLLSADLSAKILNLYSRPYSVVQKDYTNALGWFVPLGSVVKLKDPRLPMNAGDFSNDPTVQRAGDNTNESIIYGRVVRKVITLPAGNGEETKRGTLTLSLPAIFNLRSTHYAPSVKIIGSSSVGGEIQFLTASIDTFGGPKSKPDLWYFPSGSAVRIFKPSDEDNGFDGVLLTTSSFNIINDAGYVISASVPTLTGTPPFIMEFDQYDEADLIDAQRNVATYISDGDGVVDRDVGEDAAYEWE